MFNHLDYLNNFLKDHRAGRFTNNSVIGVHRTAIAPSYRVIGVHKLTPDENRSKHNLFIDIVDATGKRMAEEIEWGWEGQRPNQIVQPVKLDKPDNEPSGNIVIGGNQNIWAKVKDKNSDKLFNVVTALPDEGPEHWNTWGHHSYYVAWMWDYNITPAPPPIPPIDTGDYRRGFKDGEESIKRKIRIILDV